MSTRADIGDFWEECCRKCPSINAASEYQVWYFGNSPEMAEELAALVLAGDKTATASLAAVNELKPDEAPVLGGLSVVTLFDGTPACVIRTTDIKHVRFLDVSAEFAALEGEGDLSLEYWRRVHREYYTKEAAELDIDFNADSLVCCEQFELLFP